MTPTTLLATVARYVSLLVAGLLSAQIATAADTTAPANTTVAAFINAGATATNNRTVTLALAATDAVGVVAYRPSESSTTPTSGTSGWVTVTSTTSYSASVSFTLSTGDGVKTVYVWFKDAAGNVSAVKSASITLDTVAPVLSAIGSTPIAGGATVTWTTNEASDSYVFFGTAAGVYPNYTWSTGGPVTSHSVTVGGLSTGTTYHYQVSSTDAAGNASTGPDMTFTTLADTTGPTNTTAANFISGGAVYTTTTAVTVQITATDTVGVVGYRLSESATTPTAATAGWVSIPTNPAYSSGNLAFTLSAGDGVKTVYVWFKDASGNVSGVASDTITLDTTAPTISTVASSGLTQSSATITWTTNEASTTQVDYGTTTSYGTTASNASLVTSHSQALTTGLVASTTYHYRVKSTDAAGNTATGTDLTFTTTAAVTDTTAPANTTAAAFINAGATAVHSTAVTLALSATDAVGVVAYRPSESATTPTAATSGWVSVTSTASYSASVPFTLSTGDGVKTVYVWFKDAAGNVSTVKSASVTLDTVAPVVSAISSTSIQGGATIIWTTNEASSSFVEFGTDGVSYPNLTWTIPNNMVTSHSVTVSGLATSATYHYRVQSYDAAGNLATGPDKTFTTLADTTGPANTTAANFINSGAVYTKTTAVTVQITATDTVGVVGYRLSESATTPTAATAGWVSVPSNPAYSSGSLAFTLSTGDGVKTVYVWFKDAAGNVSAVASDTITLDTTAPVLSAITSTGITSTGATITWTTNEAANTQVDYGTSVSYGSTATTATLVTSHSQALTGLTAGTLYHYRVKSTDAAGNLVTGTDNTLTTTSGTDTTAPANTTATTFINAGAAYTKTTAVTLALSATDAVGVVAYRPSESATTPTAGTSGWITVTSTTAYSASVAFTLSTVDGMKTVYVWFKDAAGNVSAVKNASITLDMVAPTISAVASTAITSTGATITWTTNEASNTQVDYGTSVSYGSTATTATLVTSHSQALTGLTAGTLYHYRVKSTDAAGNLVTGTDNTFTTTAPSDTTAPANTTSATFVNAGAAYTKTTAVTLALSATDAVGVVAYLPSESATTPTAATPGWLTVTSATTYSASVPFTLSTGDSLKTIYVWFKDAAGNVSSVQSATITLDTTAPVISTIAVTGITATGAMVTWTTNEASNTQVDYGPTVSYPSSSSSSTLVTSHSQILTGLTSSTLYHYRVDSTDAAGNITSSADGTFTTTSAIPAVALYFIHPDHLDTPRQISDQSQKTIWRWDNTDPFGYNVANEDPDGDGVSFTCNLRFPGQYFDKETNLHYNYFRDYDPATGRYVESDPIGLRAGINTYSYADPNPLSYVDRFGLQSIGSSTLGRVLGGAAAGGARGFPAGLAGLIGGVAIGAVLSCADTAPTLRDKCERQCDADNKRAADFCHSMAVMKGKKGTKAYARTYQSCMAQADDIYIECYQNCARDYPSK